MLYDDIRNTITALYLLISNLTDFLGPPPPSHSLIISVQVLLSTSTPSLPHYLCAGPSLHLHPLTTSLSLCRSFSPPPPPPPHYPIISLPHNLISLCRSSPPPPPPHNLSYNYPPPTPTTLHNITNALVCVPKLYVQVILEDRQTDIMYLHAYYTHACKYLSYIW